VNAELIKFVESTPDTIVTLTSDQKLLVLETVDEVIEKVLQYRRSAYGQAPAKIDRSEEKEESQT